MKKLKNLRQCNGKLQNSVLSDVVMLRCDDIKCGQVHFGSEPNSLCPDCGRGSLQVVKTNE